MRLLNHQLLVVLVGSVFVVVAALFSQPQKIPDAQLSMLRAASQSPPSWQKCGSYTTCPGQCFPPLCDLTCKISPIAPGAPGFPGFSYAPSCTTTDTVNICSVSSIPCGDFYLPECALDEDLVCQAFCGFFGGSGFTGCP